MGKKYYWLQLKEDFFRQKEIKLLRKIAGETNQRGALFFTDVHHLNGSTVGMGNDRSKVSHVGRMVVCLCREEHGEIHTIGEKAFFDKHHIVPIKLTEESVKLLNL